MQKRILTLLLAMLCVLMCFSAVPVIAESQAQATPEIELRGVQLTEPDGGAFDVRFVAVLRNVDLTKYSAVGYRITATRNGTEVFSKTLQGTVLLKTLKATANGTMKSYTAAELGGDCILALAVTGIPATDEGQNVKIDISVTPYLTPIEGNEESGTQRSVQFDGGKTVNGNDWALSELPKYQGGTPASAVYEPGPLLRDYGKTEADSSRVMTVSNTTATEFEAYVTRLMEVGFAVTQRETLEDNRYVTLQNNAAQVYTYYVEAEKKVHIVYDAVSDTVAEISTPMTQAEIDAAVASGKGAVFYQYGLNHNCQSHPDKPWDNGMLLVVRCADDSLIVIDGGSSDQPDHVRLNDFLHEAAGAEAGEKVTISAWVITHLHHDHVDGFRKFINEYYAQYDLRSICANVPYELAKAETDNGELLKRVKTLAENLNAWYPDLMEIQIHTGQKLQFADVTLQALYTHEDRVNAQGNSQLSGKDFNHTSTVFKVEANGMSMMVLGDSQKYTFDAVTPISADAYLTKVYTEATLQCDIVQVAHHSLNGVRAVYQKIKAKVYFIPQTLEGFLCTSDEHEDIKRDLLQNDMFPNYAIGYEAGKLDSDDDMIFFMGSYDLTVGVQKINGELVKVYPKSQSGLETEEDTDAEIWGDLQLFGA